MKAELELPQELVEQIAERVLQKMLPVLREWHEPDQYLNVDEVSAMLGTSKAQIYQWVNNASHGLSDFPYQKAGRSLRFSKKDIQKWMKSRKNG
ncbi:MAG TPA: helix-turn-helix domain-containing protein [Paludibacter sp.]|nr:helix-turn-helix domain-containing protein [Paludibacter sp.]